MTQLSNSLRALIELRFARWAHRGVLVIFQQAVVLLLLERLVVELRHSLVVEQRVHHLARRQVVQVVHLGNTNVIFEILDSRLYRFSSCHAYQLFLLGTTDIICRV